MEPIIVFGFSSFPFICLQMDRAFCSSVPRMEPPNGMWTSPSLQGGTNNQALKHNSMSAPCFPPTSLVSVGTPLPPIHESWLVPLKPTGMADCALMCMGRLGLVKTIRMEKWRPSKKILTANPTPALKWAWVGLVFRLGLGF